MSKSVENKNDSNELLQLVSFKIGNEEFIFPTCTSYGIKNGKIFEVRVHTGDQHTVDRYFWGVIKLKGIPARLAE